jgi:hypothetical protein
VNVADIFPLATVTDAGVVAALLLLVSFTAIPLAGASPFRVTVAVEFVPPVKDVGVTTTDCSIGGTIVSVAVAL